MLFTSTQSSLLKAIWVDGTSSYRVNGVFMLDYSRPKHDLNMNLCHIFQFEYNLKLIYLTRIWPVEYDWRKLIIYFLFQNTTIMTINKYQHLKLKCIQYFIYAECKTFVELLLIWIWYQSNKTISIENRITWKMTNLNNKNNKF